MTDQTVIDRMKSTPEAVAGPVLNRDDLPKYVIDGADLLDRVHAWVNRFVCFPSIMAGHLHTLWLAHTHLMDVWFSTPRLAVLSPEPGSGKSRLLEITALLVPNPLLSVMSSPAFVLRKISNQDDRPTILYDEIDAIFGPNAKGNEDLRAMVNAGYRRGASIGRCYTDKGIVHTQELATYGAIAMGGLGDLPDTIMSRSIIIRMRKRLPDEVVEQFRPVLHEGAGLLLGEELAAWADSVSSAAEATKPTVPNGVEDRNADIFEPLLIIAELAGGSWPDRARAAATEFVQAQKAGKMLSLAGQLLVDIHHCFGDDDRLPTKKLVDRLLADEEAPWGDIKGKKLDARKLATLLRPYGIGSTTIRTSDNSTPKGYLREDFHDAWKRYLPVTK